MERRHRIIRDRNLGYDFIRIHERMDIPVDLGRLDRDFFDELGSWMVVKYNEALYIAYRIGIKRGFRDSEGDPMELHIYFPLILGKRKENVNQKDLYKKCLEIADVNTRKFSMQMQNRSIKIVLQHPPYYTIEELRKDLGGANKGNV